MKGNWLATWLRLQIRLARVREDLVQLELARLHERFLRKRAGACMPFHKLVRLYPRIERGPGFPQCQDNVWVSPIDWAQYLVPVNRPGSTGDKFA